MKNITKHGDKEQQCLVTRSGATMPSNKEREEMTTMHNNEQQHTTTRTNKKQSSIKNIRKKRNQSIHKQ
jgi:hypothetical protein